MKRSLRSLYIVVGVISIILYVLGIVTGIYVQKSLLSSVETAINSIKSDVENAQQEYILFSLRGKESCPILSSLSIEISNKLRNLANELIDLESKGESGSKFIELKKEYGVLSIRSWILRSAINANCDEDILPVLFYYSVPCPDCLQQGRILDELREENYLEKASVYVLDKDIDHPLVKTLVKSHNVTIVPSIVVGDKVYQGFINKENLIDIICQETIATKCVTQMPL